MKKLAMAGIIARVSIAFILFTVFGAIFCGLIYTKELLQPGNRYEIIRPIYLDAWYHDLGNKQISREAARAYLEAEHNADRVWHAFRSDVPAGTIMTILGPAPKVRYFFFFTSKIERYYVRLEPDPSRGLDVELSLDRGIEGSLDGLNPKLFRRLQNNENQIR